MRASVSTARSREADGTVDALEPGTHGAEDTEASPLAIIERLAADEGSPG